MNWLAVGHTIPLLLAAVRRVYHPALWYAAPPPPLSLILTFSLQKGITVVNPKPEYDLRRNKPLELQKMDKIHRVCPLTHTMGAEVMVLYYLH